jgi:hypothetical protein
VAKFHSYVQQAKYSPTHFNLRVLGRGLFNIEIEKTVYYKSEEKRENKQT